MISQDDQEWLQRMNFGHGHAMHARPMQLPSEIPSQEYLGPEEVGRKLFFNRIAFEASCSTRSSRSAQKSRSAPPPLSPIDQAHCCIKSGVEETHCPVVSQAIQRELIGEGIALDEAPSGSFVLHLRLPSETGRGQQTVFGLGCPAKAARKPDFRVASRSGCRQAQRNDLGHFCYGCGLLPRNLGLHAGSVTETCGSTGNL